MSRGPLASPAEGLPRRFRLDALVVRTVGWKEDIVDWSGQGTVSFVLRTVSLLFFALHFSEFSL